MNTHCQQGTKAAKWGGGDPAPARYGNWGCNNGRMGCEDHPEHEPRYRHSTGAAHGRLRALGMVAWRKENG